MFANGVDRVPPEVRTGSSMPQATKIGWMLLLSSLPLFAQSNSGELRLRVTDPDGLAVQSFVDVQNIGLQPHAEVVSVPHLRSQQSAERDQLCRAVLG